jgi:DNA-binding MarR family transcriptional regulator
MTSPASPVAPPPAPSAPGAALSTELRTTTMRLARRLRQERAIDELSDPQFTVLAYVVRHGATFPAVLAAWEHVSPPSMNRTVNALETQGLAVRSPSGDDGRRVLVEATAAGHDVVEETRRRRDAWLEERLAGLDADDVSTVRRAVEILGSMMRS